MTNFLQKIRLTVILVLVLLLSTLSSTKPSSQTFFEDHLESNMITTSRYALVAQYNEQQKRPILKKLNFDTMKVETILLDKLSDWVADYPISIVDFKNGDIALGQGYYLFILDNETLRVKQTLPFPKDDVISDINFYRDPKTNQSTYFIGRGRQGKIFSELQRSEDGKYNISMQQFATEAYRSHFGQMTFTSKDTAISIKQPIIQYWTNLRSIVDRQTDKKYLMKSRKLVAVSYDETFFILKNDTGFLQFYNLSEDYEVTLKYTFFDNLTEYKKSALTDDDKFLLASSQTLKNKFNVAKIDILTKEITIVPDSDGSLDNQIDFALFSSNYDRFVTLAKKEDSYYLQLRKFSTLQILDEFQLLFQFVGKEYKVISSPGWGPNFAVAIMFQKAYTLKNTIIFSFSISGDKISKIKTDDYIVENFNYILHPSMKYFVCTWAEHFRFYHFPNLTFAKQFYVPSNKRHPEIIIQKQRMIARNMIYNLGEQISFKGQLVQDPRPLKDAILIPFQKRGIVYYASTSIDQEFSITKIIYNVSAPSLRSQIYFQSCSAAVYYISPEGNSLCNFVIYLQYSYFDPSRSLTLVKYNECSKQSTKYPIGSFQYASGAIFLSSDKKYVLIIQQQQMKTNQTFLEVRETVSLDKYIYRRTLEMERQDRISNQNLLFSNHQNCYSIYLSFCGYEMDIAQDNIVLFKTPKFIFTDFLSSQNSSQDANLRHSVE